MSDNIEKFHSLDIELEYKDVVDKYAEKCCGLVKSKSPKGHRGSYASGWRTKSDKTYGGGYGNEVYNATDYQLTHLLENGHLIVNKKNGTGWASAHPHIEPAYKSVKNKFIKEMQNVSFKMTTK